MLLLLLCLLVCKTAIKRNIKSISDELGQFTRRLLSPAHRIRSPDMSRMSDGVGICKIVITVK